MIDVANLNFGELNIARFDGNDKDIDHIIIVLTKKVAHLIVAGRYVDVIGTSSQIENENKHVKKWVFIKKLIHLKNSNIKMYISFPFTIKM